MKARAKGGNIDFLLKMKQLIDMAARTLKIATRKSPLALWQANFVKDRLEALHPQLQVELVPMSTQGDKILDTPLAKVGGVHPAARKPRCARLSLPARWGAAARRPSP